MTDDQALAWKLGFGAIVLVFSGINVAMRKPAPEPMHAAPAVLQPTAPQPASLMLAEPTPAPKLPPQPGAVEAPPPQLAPAEAETKEEEPARIQVSIARPRPVVRKPAKHPAPAVVEVRASRASPVRLHRVVAEKRASPYAIGKQHYPYSPRDRARSRELP